MPTLGLCLASAPAFAQPSVQTPAPAPTAEDPKQPPAVSRGTDGPADRFGALRGGQLQVSSGTDDGQLTFRVALPDLPSTASRFSLSASTPLGDGDNAMPASLDALANGSRVTLSWGYFDIRVGRPSEAQRRVEDRASLVCWDTLPRRDDNRDGERCDDSNYAMNWYDRTNYRKNQRGYPAATDFGIDASIGSNEFEWFDRVSLVPRKERRTDWSVAAHVARYLPGSHTALTGSVSYQRAFEAAEEERVCPPGTTDPEAECPDMRTAGPTRNENLLLAVGLRHRILGADGNLGNFAVAPIVTYDVIDDVVGVDVPVYYTPDGEGGLNGGVRFGYRSDRENEFSVAFFVGTTFDIFGGR
ncbi:MAG TPA: hypothetical protein VF603_07045 [Allosphingosinicella sp.]|jgi:hypothetical protein